MDEVRTGYPYEMGADDPFSCARRGGDCPVCSGRVPSDHPAVRAVGWGFIEAGAKGPQDDHWSSATVLGAYHALLKRDPGALDPVLDDWLREEEGALSSRSFLETTRLVHLSEPAIPDYIPEGGDDQVSSWPRPSVRSKEKVREIDGSWYLWRLLRWLAPGEGDTRIPTRTPGDDDWSWPWCCVRRFEYPLQWATTQKPGRAGIAFNAMAEYIEPERNCLCECCLFRQYARLSGHFTPAYSDDAGAAAKERHLPASDTFTEDCVYVWEDANLVTQKRSAVLHDAPAPSETFDAFGDPAPAELSCYGKKGPNQPDQWFDPTLQDNECAYVMRDYPGVDVAPNSTFFLHFEFLGRIVDRCNPPRIAAEKKFSLVLSGYVGPSGEVTYTHNVSSGWPTGYAPLVTGDHALPLEEGDFEDIDNPTYTDFGRIFGVIE